MKQILINDVTMKQPAGELSLSFKEKIELAKLLDKLGVSVIELEGIHSPKIDALRIKSIATAVTESVVAVPVELNNKSVQATWEALSLAKRPRLQVCAPVSSVQMEYLFHKKPDAMEKAIAETVSACKALCADVEFIADDATRGEPEFLARAINAAVDAGASAVTLCDTAGTMLPEEFAAFMKNLMETVPALNSVQVGASCADTLAMADACVIAALGVGVSQIKAAAWPVNTAALAKVSRVIAARADTFGVNCPVRVNQLSRTMEQISRICQPTAGKQTPYSGILSREDDGCYLTAHDDLSGVAQAAQQLGYDLSAEDSQKVYDAFCVIAAKKEQVSIRELDAIIASAAMQVPPTYTLDTYMITAGNTISATAHMRLKKQESLLEGVCMGDGPIDAAFLAIEQITGRHYELDDFQIQAVTEGREAMGQTVVKLRWNGKLYSGRGISTDIVGASIHAYLSALNKIVYEEDVQ